MRRTTTTVLAAVAAFGALTGCDPEGVPIPVGLNVEVVEFDPAGFNGPPFTAIIDSANSAEAFAGWFEARRGTGSTLPEVVRRPELLADPDTYVYLAAVTSTGCRAPTGAELRRVGDDLRPEFVGGTDRPECYRAYTPFAVYKIARAAVGSVVDLTVDGAASDRDGPAESVGRIELSPAAADFTPREVGEPGARTALADELAASGTDRVRATLDGTSRLLEQYGPTNLRRYAFPVRSCPDDVVTLHVGPTELRAAAYTPVDAPRTCEAPTAHLVVFDIRSVHVPNRARPVR